MMCNHALNRKNGRLIFTFHHWRAEAWSELTCSLKDAGFILVNQYVVFSENPVSVHINGLNSLKHDTILILKPTSVAEESKEWNEPAPINREESYLFCKQCGDALGWFLASDLSKQEILMKWKQLIEGKENG
jgi:adenine-specific DNA methylase